MSATRPQKEFVSSLSDALDARFGQINGRDCGNLYRMTMLSVEAELVAFALRKCGGNCSEAARMLGISRTTLMRKKKAAERLHEN